MAANDVESVVLLPGHVQGHEGDEAGDLHEEVDDDGEPRVEGERVDGRHVGQGAQEEARRLGDRGEQHRGAHFAHLTQEQNKFNKAFCYNDFDQI